MKVVIKYPSDIRSLVLFWNYSISYLLWQRYSSLTYDERDIIDKASSHEPLTIHSKDYSPKDYDATWRYLRTTFVFDLRWCKTYIDVIEGWSPTRNVTLRSDFFNSRKESHTRLNKSFVLYSLFHSFGTRFYILDILDISIHISILNRDSHVLMNI